MKTKPVQKEQNPSNYVVSLPHLIIVFITLGMIVGMIVTGANAIHGQQGLAPVKSLQKTAEQVTFDEETIQFVKDAECSTDCSISIDEPFTVDVADSHGTPVVTTVEVPSMEINYDKSGKATTAVPLDGGTVSLSYFVEDALLVKVPE